MDQNDRERAAAAVAHGILPSSKRHIDEIIEELKARASAAEAEVAALRDALDHANARRTSHATTHEPAPAGSGTPVWPLVVADMQARDETGREKYGTPLRTHNGRRALVDAYQEALDLVVYLRQHIEEQGYGSGLPSRPSER